MADIQPRGPKSAAPPHPTVAVLSSAGGGGGGIAARRLAQALNQTGSADARFLTGTEIGEMLPRQVAPMVSMNRGLTSNTHFTLEYPGYRRDWLVDFLCDFDVVNIHWASYLLSLAEIGAMADRGQRMIFTLHDFHYITGGCHYPAGCTGFAHGCLACPQVDDRLCDPGFVPVNLAIKREIFASQTVHLTAPSRYLRDRAVDAGTVPEARAHVLRNPYTALGDAPAHPRDDLLRLVIVADSLTESRKGMPLAVETLNLFATQMRRSRPDRFVMVHVIGHADPALEAALNRIDLPHRLHGRIRDHSRMVDIYAICDMILTCSYEDNWPNVLVEAGSYGVTPVVGPGHGCEEFVRTYGLGEVAADYTPESFATAMLAALAARADTTGRDAFSRRVREDHRPDLLAGQFLEIVGGIA